MRERVGERGIERINKIVKDFVLRRVALVLINCGSVCHSAFSFGSYGYRKFNLCSQYLRRYVPKKMEKIKTLYNKVRLKIQNCTPASNHDAKEAWK
jgi:hypothetical protein